MYKNGGKLQGKLSVVLFLGGLRGVTSCGGQDKDYSGKL